MEPPIVLHTSDVLRLSDDELFRLCAANRDLRIERDNHGNLILMSPSGSKTSRRNSKLIQKLSNWNDEARLGEVFDSSGGFLLPDTSMRAPDAAWIATEQWEQFSEEEQEKFLPVCPDFVIELRSPSDRLVDLQQKMREWMDNGCRLGWLIDPVEEKAHVYHVTGAPRVVESFDEMLSGEEVLPGFELSLKELR